MIATVIQRSFLQYALLLEQVYSDFVGKKITEYEYEDWPVHNDVLALLLDKVKKR